MKGKVRDMVGIDILGSCVCRDIFRHQETNRYKVNRCFSCIPLSVTSANILPRPQEYIETFPGTVFEKRMLKVQSSKRAIQYLKESNSEYLVIDLAEEVRNRFVTDGQTPKILPEIEGYEDWYDWMYKSCGVTGERKQYFDIDMDTIDKAYKQFAEEIIRTEENPNGYEEKKIIVIESYYATTIMGNDIAVRPWESEYNTKEYNECLAKLYMILYKYIQNCTIIKVPELTHSSENHLRGKAPLHFESHTYKYFLDVLNIVCGFSKINTIENLYQEKSLRNKIDMRVSNCGMIYSFKERIMKLENSVKHS